MESETNSTPAVGLLTDHGGKKSSLRYISVGAAIVFFVVVLGEAFGLSEGLSFQTQGILALMAVAPQGVKHMLEKK